MDMSVKLNPPYPVVRPVDQGGDKTASRSVELAPERKKDNAPRSVDNTDNVKKAVSEIEKFLKESQRNLKFSTDEESGQIVVRVIASDTGELIRQLPSEEALRIAHSLNDVKSVLFDAKA